MLSLLSVISTLGACVLYKSASFWFISKSVLIITSSFATEGELSLAAFFTDFAASCAEVLTFSPALLAESAASFAEDLSSSPALLAESAASFAEDFNSLPAFLAELLASSIVVNIWFLLDYSKVDSLGSYINTSKN